MKPWLKVFIGFALIGVGLAIWLWLNRKGSQSQTPLLAAQSGQENVLSLIAQIAVSGSTMSGNKVDKEPGKGLSVNDYTTDEKEKLAGISLVATSGSYADLANKPFIPAVASDVGAYSTTQTDNLLSGKISFLSTSSMDEVNAAATGPRRLFIELDNGSSADAELYYYSPRVGRYKVFIFK
ncbi:hypothetical protein GO755_33400 [Spirosoma sp. HMF4905]|uniref:Uncharacterized protein n=1 Tax=Spirosoma arboris TaxID=2682092 RepID=A0A7K1SME1_9BACT|nr:hypothetical protein [Spirosoma arboris]MVM34972.1 hypothetical protein [Spirosoma arboris]